MLTQIHIRSLATIEELQLNFNAATTMITGETGAGKSVFIEAIELALGGRASSNLIRPGKDKAEISLSFDVRHFPKVISKLKSLDLYEETDCIIRRVITHDGRSRCYVNGSLSPLQLAKELGELLFHMHGQHEQQILLNAETQREMLDRYAEHIPLATEVAHLAEEWRETEQKLHLLKNQAAERNDRCAFLQFQLNEFKQIALQEGEWEILESNHRRLAHAEELLKHIQQAANLIADDHEKTILSQLSEVRKNLDAVHQLDPKTKHWIETLENALIAIKDLEAELNNYLEKTELDPEQLQAMEARISQIFSLARKHKINPEQLVNFEEKLTDELNKITNADENIAQLVEKQNSIAKLYQEKAAKLSEQRRKAAKRLEKIISHTIQSLSLPHGEFKINLAPDNHDFSPHGLEKINFLIKTNPDQSLQPLAKVISGGELSRLSLALHLALANQTNIPTLVFDEVDTGLSGATAVKIGKLLRELGNSYQVFCITHQPQVAACGHQHLLVEKNFADSSTFTRLRLLNPKEKTAEIARMLGGEKITPTTLEHAQEILSGI